MKIMNEDGSYYDLSLPCSYCGAEPNELCKCKQRRGRHTHTYRTNPQTMFEEGHPVKWPHIPRFVDPRRKQE